MPEISHSAHDMISGLTPRLREGAFIFVSVSDPSGAAALLPSAVASFREDEGMSLILPVQAALDAGFDISSPMACITLDVYSSLEGVGLTAAVSAALGAQGIACNMVAACHHDHVFVPVERKDQALAILLDLQRSTANDA